MCTSVVKPTMYKDSSPSTINQKRKEKKTATATKTQPCRALSIWSCSAVVKSKFKSQQKPRSFIESLLIIQSLNFLSRDYNMPFLVIKGIKQTSTWPARTIVSVP